MSLLKKCRLSPALCLFFSFVLLMDAIFITDAWIIFLVIYFSVFVHEVAHALTGIFFGYEIELIKLTTYGGYARFTTTKWLDDNRHKFHIAIAGPLSNLLLSGVCLYINQPFWAELNLTFALFNLIPILPMDGAHVLDGVVGKYTENKLIIPIVGIIVGVVAASMMVSTNFIASLFLVYFVVINFLHMLEVIDVERFKTNTALPPEIIKGKILFLEKQKHCIPIGMDREILYIVDQINHRLQSEDIDLPISKLAQEVVDDWCVKYDDRYELEIRVIR